ncbi:acyl-coenzyme A thioesterase 1-like isoform X2 [Heptranchias perlo]|uniref:acyl-coenzyme A thioesterase 1-like isoform X2 n=1 Tax=Heptranchias perlo TaxID=212740 RepID=UPI00355A1E05
MLLFGGAGVAVSLLSRCWSGRGPLSHRAWMAVSVRVHPSPKCLFDEPVQVRVSGLSPLQQVTMKASLTDEKGQAFRSFAFYRADGQGELDLSQSPSLGGHYTGTEPMGLFWSLTSGTPFTRLVKKDVASSPLYVNIEVFDGHGTLGRLPEQPLAASINERWFMKEGVRRIPVREGRVRGTLFVPPGDGPFPGVIDMYGSVGGVVEHRASLLANHGFLTLTLGYFGYDDLPMDFTNLDLEYFEEAVNVLRQHPKVKGPGVGAIGISKGADLVLSMITFLPHVIAAISIGGCNANTLEKAEGHFLFVVGEDDKNWNTPLYVQQAVEKLKENGRENYEVISYPEAGHLLEPAFFPFCYASFHRLVGLHVIWGGQLKPHSLAQVDLWPKIQTFLRKHLEKQSKL